MPRKQSTVSRAMNLITWYPGTTLQIIQLSAVGEVVVHDPSVRAAAPAPANLPAAVGGVEEAATHLAGVEPGHLSGDNIGPGLQCCCLLWPLAYNNQFWTLLIMKWTNPPLLGSSTGACMPCMLSDVSMASDSEKLSNFPDTLSIVSSIWYWSSEI